MACGLEKLNFWSQTAKSFHVVLKLSHRVVLDINKLFWRYQVRVNCGSTRLTPRVLTMLWRNWWSITGKTQEKPDVNLLTVHVQPVRIYQRISLLSWSSLEPLISLDPLQEPWSIVTIVCWENSPKKIRADWLKIVFLFLDYELEISIACALVNYHA